MNDKTIAERVESLREQYPDLTPSEQTAYEEYLRGDKSFWIFRCTFDGLPLNAKSPPPL